MERLTMLIDSHLLDNGKLDKEYSLTNKMEFNEFGCMDIPNAIYNKLGELEDVLEKWNIEDLGGFIEEQIAKKRELNDILWRMEKEFVDLQYQLDVAEKALELLSKSNISNVMEEERQPLIDYIKELAEADLSESKGG